MQTVRYCLIHVLQKNPIAKGKAPTESFQPQSDQTGRCASNFQIKKDVQQTEQKPCSNTSQAQVRVKSMKYKWRTRLTSTEAVSY